MSSKLPERFHLTIKVGNNPDVKGGIMAHCIEMDLMGFGDTGEEALQELFSAIMGQIEGAESPDQIFFESFPKEHGVDDG